MAFHGIQLKELNCIKGSVLLLSQKNALMPKKSRETTTFEIKNYSALFDNPLGFRSPPLLLGLFYLAVNPSFGTSPPILA